jgi:hypothetical protein
MGRRPAKTSQAAAPAASLGERRRLLRWLAEATLSPPRSGKGRRRRSLRLWLRLGGPAAAEALAALARRIGCRSRPKASGRGALLELAARQPLLKLLERAAGLAGGDAAAAVPGRPLPAAAPAAANAGHRCRLRQGWRRLAELAAALGLVLRPQRWRTTGARDRRWLRLLLGAYGSCGAVGSRLRLVLAWPSAQTAQLRRLQRLLANRQRRQRNGRWQQRLELASGRTLERLLLLAGPPPRPRHSGEGKALVRGQRLLERLAAGLELRRAEWAQGPESSPLPPEPSRRRWRRGLLELLAGAGGVAVSGEGRPLLWLLQPPQGFGALAQLPLLLGSRAQPRPQGGRRSSTGDPKPPPEERWRLSLSGRPALERLVQLANGRPGPLLAQLRLRQLCRLLGQPHRFSLWPSCRRRPRPPAGGGRLEGVGPHRWWWRPRSPHPLVEWCRWAAGLVDGDGYLRVRRGGGAELAVTAHHRSRPLLQRLRWLLGGTIYRQRSGLLRFVLGRRPELRRMVELLGPHLRLAHRRRQLAAVAHKLGEPLPPLAEGNPGGWLVGGVESDGSVGLRGYSGPDAAPHPFVELVNTDPAFLEPYRRLFGGKVRKDSPPQKAHHRQSYR